MAGPASAEVAQRAFDFAGQQLQNMGNSTFQATGGGSKSLTVPVPAAAAAGDGLTIAAGGANGANPGGNLILTAGAGTPNGACKVAAAADLLGFYAAAGVAKQTVTGSRATGAALADLLTKLANLGLIVDGTVA